MSWIECQLGDILTLKRGYDLPHAARKDGDIPVVSSSGVTGYHNTAKVDGPAVVTGRYGTLGEVYYVEGECWPLNTALYVQDFKGNRPKFVYYFLQSILKGMQSDKAGVPGVNRNDLHARNVICTKDHALQAAVEELISPYDDLIENNRRRIQLLEDSARLLYQEWFVHLRFPGHEQVKITDGVPEGWSIKRVDSLLGKVAKKKKIKKEEYLEDGVVPCVDQSQEFIGGYVDDEEAAITENLPIVVFGDHTRIVKFIDFPFAPGADGTQLLVPNDEEIPRDFFYFMISSINVANAFYARHFKFLKAKDVLVPEKKLMHEFSLVVKDNMLQIKLLRNQNRSLAKARDLLLPKLMSGELTV